MTTTAAPETADPHPATPRRPFRRWVGLGVVVVLVVCGAITGVFWYRHYADAPSLTGSDAQFGFLPPDNRHSHFRTAGPFTVDIAPIREGKRQGFMLWVDNPSAVTQTILGVAHARLIHASVTASSRQPIGGTDPGNRFEHTPVDIPPHSTRSLHYYVRIVSCNEVGSGPGWQDIQLRVRVGRFIRTETLSLGGDFEYELLGAAQTRPC